MCALRFEVGRLLKDAWDASFRAHVGFLFETRLAVASEHEGTRAKSQLRVDEVSMSGVEACDFDLETHPQRGSSSDSSRYRECPGGEG